MGQIKWLSGLISPLAPVVYRIWLTKPAEHHENVASVDGAPAEKENSQFFPKKKIQDFTYFEGITNSSVLLKLTFFCRVLSSK